MRKDIALRKILRCRYEMDEGIVSLLTRYNIDGVDSKQLYDEIVKVCRRYAENMSVAIRDFEHREEMLEQYGLSHDAEQKIFNFITQEWGIWYQQ